MMLQDNRDNKPIIKTDWENSWYTYQDHLREEEAEAAREAEEVEAEVLVYETHQAAMRELERVVSYLHVCT